MNSLKELSTKAPSSIINKDRGVSNPQETASAFNKYFVHVIGDIQSNNEYNIIGYHNFLPLLNTNFFF